MKQGLLWACAGTFSAAALYALMLQHWALGATLVVAGAAAAAGGLFHPARRRLRRKRERQRLRHQASSEIYVDAHCCVSCGVPWSVAPDLFEAGDDGCAVRQQPRTVPELRRALRVFVEQDLGCVRYRGEDRRVVALLTRVGCRAHCD